MHRPGTNPDNVQVGDVLCDFCGIAWDGASPVVEGHQGSIICGRCLTSAYAAVVLAKAGDAGCRCAMCLEERPDRSWRAEGVGGRPAAICRRCIDQAAGALHKAPEYDWRKPTSSPAVS